jgi:hypothetical protein
VYGTFIATVRIQPPSVYYLNVSATAAPFSVQFFLSVSPGSSEGKLLRFPLVFVPNETNAER